MKKVYPNVSKSYFSARDALEDSGFEFIGHGYEPAGKDIFIFSKNGSYYRFLNMEHYNTTVYEIDLLNINKYLKNNSLDIVTPAGVLDSI